MTTLANSPIITVAELLALRNQPDVLLFESTNSPTSRQDFEAAHLSGAYYVDVNAQLANIKPDAADGGRHPLPELSTFSKTLGQLGIRPGSHVIIYDRHFGANAAARFWWMLKSIGHEKVQVLSGGFRLAEAAGFPLAQGPEKPSSGEDYPLNGWQWPVADLAEVEITAGTASGMVVDVRESGRYLGQFEPIDLIAGHIPGAVNVPFADNLSPLGTFLSPDTLKSKYLQLTSGKSENELIIHCGSGVTACHTILAMNYAGLPTPKLYVGSWSEWSRNNKPIATA